jgi:CubicO group peptidase (beta-lactamase class C family)
MIPWAGPSMQYTRRERDGTLKSSKSKKEQSLLRFVPPRSAGMDSRKLSAAWRGVKTACEAGAFAGAVGLVARNGRTVLHDACGNASLYPRNITMRINFVFDLASVTKAIVTSTAILQLIQNEKLSLTDKVSSILPQFSDDDNGWKAEINIEQLLTHTSGLPAWSDLYARHQNAASMIDEICSVIDPIAEPGTTFTYSDLGFILLGRIVEVVSGNSLDEFAKVNIFSPLGMKDSQFNPSASSRIVATEYSNWRGRFVRGEVHDENAFAMGGVGGHAGLFSTGLDLATFCQALLDDRKSDRILSEASTRVMSTNHTESLGGYVGLGWWVRADSTPNISKRLSPLAFGHNGYTGTSVWVDPQYDLIVILLTNRVHPVREGSPVSDKSVGIMMTRKMPWGKANQEFQGAVIDSIL